MFSKSQNWMRYNFKTARFRYAAVLSFVVLVVLFGVVKANGPMRPQPPHQPGMGGPQGPGMGQMGGPGMGQGQMGGPGMGQMGQMGPQQPGMGMWGHMKQYWFPTGPVPSIKILAVVKDQSVTFETKDFPEDQDFTVTMGKMYTRGVNGIEVGTFNSGDGGTFEQTFEIPEDLYGQYQISIRAQTDHAFPYFAFNWFYNNTTDKKVTAVEETTKAASSEETTEATTEETTEAAPEATTEEEPALVGQVWQWEEFTDPVNGTQVVDGPEKYLIEFLAEGGINIQADCNVGNGTYVAGDDSTLSISVGAMTLALCEPESLSDQFVNNLSAAAVYFFADGNLYIDLAADSGTMMFGPNGVDEAGTGGADTTEGEAVADDAATTEGEATTDDAATTDGEATTDDAATTEGEAQVPADETGLVGTVWQWSEFTDPVQGTVIVDNPEVYTAEFLDDGTVNVQADCNSGRGNFTVEESSITISDLAMTRALCAPESLSDQYVEYLSAAAIYFFEEGDLYLDLPADSGTMRFVAAAEPTAAISRGTTYKVVHQDDAEAVVEEDPVPSFKICTVVKNESVTIVTENFPADQEFKVQMGPMAEPMQSMGMGPSMGMGQQSMGMGPSMGMGQQSMGMGPSMGMGQQPMGMGPSMGMGQQPMGMGPSMGMGQQPMGPMSMGSQKVWIPYYKAGTMDSGEGGSLTETFEIPVDYLYGTSRISIVLRTAGENPYIAYNWFYNNDAEVCNGD